MDSVLGLSSAGCVPHVRNFTTGGSCLTLTATGSSPCSACRKDNCVGCNRIVDVLSPRATRLGGEVTISGTNELTFNGGNLLCTIASGGVTRVGPGANGMAGLPVITRRNRRFGSLTISGSNGVIVCREASERLGMCGGSNGGLCRVNAGNNETVAN